MDRSKLLGYKEVKRWLVGKSDVTKNSYLTFLKEYVTYRGKNPKELIDEIEEDRKKSKRDIGEVEVKIKEFYEWLTKTKEKIHGGFKSTRTGVKGIGKKSAVTTLGAIRGFYKANGFVLSFKTPRAATKKINKKLVLRAEQVKKLIDHAPTLRDKAIILMMFQSGMDVSTLCSLDYGDVAKGLERYQKTEDYPLPIHVVRSKKEIEYTTFLGKDGVEALIAFLNKRREKYGQVKYNDPLFIKEKNYNGKTRMEIRLIEKMLREVAVLSGVVSEEEMERADMNPCRPHALRAAFSSIMKLQGVNNEIVEYWVGHAIPYEAAYLIPQEEELKKIYAEHEEALSINRATGLVKQLERKYDNVLSKQALKIDAMEDELKKQKEFTDRFKKMMENPRQANEILTFFIQKVIETNPEMAEKLKEMI